MNNTSGYVRVCVFDEKKLADIALPAGLPLRDLVGPVSKLLAAETENDGPAGTADGLPHDRVFKPIVGAPFSLDATLEALPVADGDVLVLTRLPERLAAEPVVEDVADAAAVFARDAFTPWDSVMLRRTALALIVVFILAAGFGLFAWQHAAGGWRPSTALVVLGAALGVLGLRPLPQIPEWGHVAVSSAGAVFLLLGVCGLVPDRTLPAVAAVSGAGAACWSLVMAISRRSSLSWHTAVIMLGSAVALAGAARLQLHFPERSTGAVLLAVALAAFAVAPGAAGALARFPLPSLPAPGDEVPDPPSAERLAEYPLRVIRAAAHQTGIVAGAVAMETLGAALLLKDGPAGQSPLAWWLLAISVSATALKARVWASAACVAWFVSAPSLVAFALCAAWAASGRPIPAASALLLAALWATALLLVSRSRAMASWEMSIPQKRALDVIEMLALATVGPVALEMIGAVAWARNLF